MRNTSESYSSRIIYELLKIEETEYMSLIFRANVLSQYR